MNINRLCSRTVVSIDAGASLQEAAMLMRTEHVGALVLTDGEVDRPHAVGLVTDRDIAIEVLAREVDPSEVAIGDIASREIATVSGDAGIAEAVTAMAEAGVRRLLVTDAQRRVVGLVSSDDLLGALAGELSAMSKALRRGIERETAERPATVPERKPVFLAYSAAGMP